VNKKGIVSRAPSSSLRPLAHSFLQFEKNRASFPSCKDLWEQQKKGTHIKERLAVEHRRGKREGGGRELLLSRLLLCTRTLPSLPSPTSLVQSPTSQTKGHLPLLMFVKSREGGVSHPRIPKPSLLRPLFLIPPLLNESSFFTASLPNQSQQKHPHYKKKR